MNRKIILIIAGAITLCFAGFNNKFPLFSSETAGYIQSGLTRQVPFDRTLLYGLFVAHISWWKSLWIVIMAQGLLLSIILFYCFKYFIQHSLTIVFYLACIFFISFCMSASVTVSAIDAGAFAGIAILSTILLLFANNLIQRDIWVIVVILTISAGMDVSYGVTCGILVLIFGCHRLIINRRLKIKDEVVKSNRLAFVAGSLVGSFLLVSLVHYMAGSDFSIVRNWRVAIVPRLVNTGFIADYCNVNCIKAETSDVCQYCDSLKTSVSPGGRFAKADLTMNEELMYSKIAADVISQGNTWKELSTQSVKDFLHELIDVRISDRIDKGRTSLAPKAIFDWYNDDFRESSISRQMARWLNFVWLNYSQIISAILCVIFSMLVIIGKIPSKLTGIHIYILLAYIIFAFTSAALYGKSNSQFQVAWLLAVPVFLQIGSQVSMRKNIQLCSDEKVS